MDKLIDEKTAGACHSGLNVFSVPPTNISVVKSQIKEVLPLNTIDELPYEFRVFSDHLWIDLSQTTLHLDLSIEKKENDIWVKSLDTDSVCFIQSIAQSFVRQIRMHINGTEVFDSSDMYPYLCYVRNELTYSRAVKKSILAITGYNLEEKQDDDTDSGFITRMQQNNGTKQEYIAKLDFDLARQNLFLLNNCDILFTIYKSDDKFLLLKQDNNTYRVKVHNIRLNIKTVEVNSSLNVGVFNMLESSSAKYAMRKMEIRTVSVPTQQQEFTYNCFNSVIPRRMIIGFVASSAFNGNDKLSPFNFKPYNVRNIQISAGGQVYPFIPQDYKFTIPSKYYSGYLDLHRYCSSLENNTTNGITLEQFLNGWAFFVIPLSPILDDCPGFELVRNGTTTVRVQFNNPLPESINVIMMGEFDHLLTIDQNRHVMTDGQV